MLLEENLLDSMMITYKNRRVCHYHFDDYYMCRNNRMSNIAVPTVNLPNIRELANSFFTPRSTLHEIQNVYCEQSTSKQSHQSTSTEPASSVSVDPRVIAPGPSLVQLVAPSVTQAADKMDTTELASSVSVDTRVIAPGPSLAQPVAPSVMQVADKMDTTEYLKSRSRKRTLMTKEQNALIKKIASLKSILKKCRTKSQERKKSLQMAKNLMTNPSFIKATENLTSLGKIITMLQLREAKKKTKGRRFTMQEKIVALSILKQSPKAYRFLRKIFVLPASQTVRNLVSRALIKPGINL